MVKIISIKHFFDHLNKEIEYLVLRNWDDLYEEKIYGDSHEDIDILCRDLKSFIRLTDAKPVFRSKYRNNYIVRIGIFEIRFDVRYVGDGYYPQKWEDEMLKRRKINNLGFYIPSDEDYFFSLAYHALLQKPFFSEEYLKKTSDAYNVSRIKKKRLNINEIRELVSDFCFRNNYRVEIPSDPGVYLNTSNLKYFEVKRSFCRLTRKCLLSLGYRMKSIMVTNLLLHK